MGSRQRERWAQGLLATTAAILFALAAQFSGAGLRLDLLIYDQVAQTSAPASPLSEIVLVASDRGLLPAHATPADLAAEQAALLDAIAAAGAKTVAYLSPLPAADSSEGRLMAATLARSGHVFLAAESVARNAAAPSWPATWLRFSRESTSPLDTATPALAPPDAPYADVAAGIGHVQWPADADGVLRTHPLMLRQGEMTLPALALATALHSLHFGPQSLQLSPMGEGLAWARSRLDTDVPLLLRPRLDRDTRATWPVLSAAEVLQGKAPPQTLNNKVVVVAPSQQGSATTAGGEHLTQAQRLAHAITAVRQGSTLRHAPWEWWAIGVATALCLGWLAWCLPRCNLLQGLLGTAGGVLLIAASEWALLRSQGLWVPAMVLVLGLIAGLLVWVGARLAAPRSRALSEREQERERLMGLALQGRGQLDEAFARWKRLNPSPQVKEHVYALAQDYERKRDYLQAKEAYKHLLRHDRDFKDALARYRRVRRKLHNPAQDSTSPSRPALAGDVGAVPLLGRYVIERELGKGAMGVVYLGRDPKIGRALAIKTMALSQEFEGHALVNARERFFREAETAGRLQHPAIVTIFDAGEEHDLAYIAMEFLKGGDLAPRTQSGHLLPPHQVLSILARVADALGYAHDHQVVHRDIKPANIMWDEATDTVKVTDFGIARITDSNKTRTGLVLGTPSFMSPEQLAGKRIDGRSDLYSLGITLFQMLTGNLPFRADSMPELMHKIAHAEPPSIHQWRSELPEFISDIVAKALQKQPHARYQTGQQFAHALHQALTQLHPAPSSAPAGVVYDAGRTTSTNDMADFEETLMELPPSSSESHPFASRRQ